jgi:hypothetical protein
MPVKLTEAECRFAITNGDFSEEVTNAAPSVALILTQSWCPQWLFMKSYLAEAEKTFQDKLQIRFLEYDRESFFQDFMYFKEEVFRNREVPYVRYYKNGILTSESNYTSKQGFLTKLGLFR